VSQAAVQGPDIQPAAVSISDVPVIEVQAAKACPRYLGRIVKGVNVKAPTPLWLKEKLRRSGIRSIDAVVDVTNYVLLELGQPMHAFDLDKIEGGIHVRLPRPDEKLKLLNGQEVMLTPQTLLIADERKALAVAGVMGAADSAVSAATQDILLEAAYFDPVAMAGKARAYGLHTDSSQRFERGVDFALQELAIER